MYIYMLQITEWDLKNLLVKRYHATIREVLCPRTPVTLTGFDQKNASSDILQAETEAPLPETSLESFSLNERLERLRSNFEENEMISGRLKSYKVDE